KQEHNIQALPALGIGTRSENPLQSIETFLKESQRTILFSVESAGRREALQELLGRINCKLEIISEWDGFLKFSPKKIGILISPLATGFMTAEYALITETELFGKQVYQER